MLKKTLVIGASGLIGSYLFMEYQRQYPDVIGTSYNDISHELIHFGLGENKLDELNIAGQCYDSVIISAGITNISYIDKNSELTRKINVDATLELIYELSKLELHVIFLSSDNVFSGQTGEYSDVAEAIPISIYGQQKKSVELEIPKICNKYTILRLAKVVGSIKSDNTILDDISRQLTQSDDVYAAEDLVFNPTAVEDIVRAIKYIQENEVYGTLNFCNPEIWNRYDLTVAMASKLKSFTKINRINFSDLGLAANRPLNTSMLNSSCFESFNFTKLETCMERVTNNWTY